MTSFGMPPFDPSKLDPKLVMQLSELIRQLPPEKISRMQTLMHNMMAGFDVRKDMEEFEKTLPPGFREKLLTLWTQTGMTAPPSTSEPSAKPSYEPTGSLPGNIKEARLTILKAVADGQMSPEEAERLLFESP